MIFGKKRGQAVIEDPIFWMNPRSESDGLNKGKSRAIELLMGLFGGMFGFLGAILSIGMGRLGETFGMPEGPDIIRLGLAAIIFSIIGIIGALMIKSRTRTAGWLMVASAYGGLISTSFSFLLPFILVLIGGIRTLRDSD